MVTNMKPAKVWDQIQVEIKPKVLGGLKRHEAPQKALLIPHHPNSRERKGKYIGQLPIIYNV